MTDHLIMIVEDDEDLREMLALIVGTHGFQTIGASDGLDALAKLEHAVQPALILLDLRMPRMNGFEFLQAIHDTPAAHIPVVALTGDATAAQDALRAGATSCLRKPVEPRALLEALEGARH